MTTRSRQTYEQLVTLPDLAIPLAEAALLVACEEYPQLSLKPYLDFLDQAADRARSLIPGEGTPETTIEALNEVLFGEYKFSGNSSDYYDARNSFLNAVIDRRTGIPIALSAVYIAVAARLDFAIEGVGVPGHFVVRHSAPDEDIFLDPFNAGSRLTRDDLLALAEQAGSTDAGAANWLRRATNRQILTRMLNNLRMIYLKGHAFDKALSMMDLMLITEPALTELYYQRGMLRLQLRQYEGAARDLRRYLDSQSGEETRAARESAERLRTIKAMLN